MIVNKTITKSKELWVEDIKRRLRDLLVFLWPILLVVLDNVDKQDIETSIYMFLSLLASALADLLRRYLVDHTQWTQKK